MYTVGASAKCIFQKFIYYTYIAKIVAKDFRFSQIRRLSYHYFVFQQCFDCGSSLKPFLSLRFRTSLLFLTRIILYSRTPIPTYVMAAIMSDILSCQRR